MDTRFVTCAGALLLAACDGDGGGFAAPGDGLVFQDRGSIQCQSDGMTPEESAQTLIDAGIDVLNSTCGYRTGVAFPSVCGAPTGEILVHQIRGVNIEHAVQLGFADIETLVDPEKGTGYELIDCDDRTPVPVPEE